VRDGGAGGGLGRVEQRDNGVSGATLWGEEVGEVGRRGPGCGGRRGEADEGDAEGHFFFFLLFSFLGYVSGGVFF